jgi:hypothetical protein
MEIFKGDSNALTTAALAENSATPLDGQIWIMDRPLGDTDWGTKRIYNDSADIPAGVENKTIIFGKGTFTGFHTEMCYLYGQGADQTVIVDAIEMTVTEDEAVGEFSEGMVVSYVARIGGSGDINGIGFVHSGADGETVDIACCILGDQAIAFYTEIKTDCDPAICANKNDFLGIGVGIAIFSSSSMIGHGNSVQNFGSGSVVFQASLIFGATLITGEAGLIIHSMTNTLVGKTQVGKGVFIDTGGTMWFLDSTQAAHDVTAHFEGIFNP